VNGFYDLGDLDNTFVAFDVNSGGDAVSNVTIMKSFSGAAGSFGPVEHTSGSLGNYSISINDAVSGLGITADQVEVGDSFTFTTTAGPSSRSLVVNASCSSALAGTYAYSSTGYFCDDAGALTGEVTITEAAAGVYDISDWAFGTYEQCYGGAAQSWGSLQLTDLCNTINIIGADNYGDSWTYTVDGVSGADLTITWANTYGEFGTVVLSRTDGTEWPPLKN